jgi:hypothetical protein
VEWFHVTQVESVAGCCDPSGLIKRDISWQTENGYTCISYAQGFCNLELVIRFVGYKNDVRRSDATFD